MSPIEKWLAIQRLLGMSGRELNGQPSEEFDRRISQLREDVRHQHQQTRPDAHHAAD